MLSTPAALAATSSDGLLPLLQQELTRAQSYLSKQSTPPYFISYLVRDHRRLSIAGSNGTLLTSAPMRRRTVDVSMRVGNPTLDNTHNDRRSSAIVSGDLPLEDNALAVAQVLWQLTDRDWKRVSENYLKVKTETAVHTQEEDDSPDFSSAPPASYVAPNLALPEFDQPRWEEKVRKYSGAFRDQPEIYASYVILQAENVARYFVSTEGSKLLTGQTVLRISIQAVTKAEDGMELLRVETFQASNPSQLPSDAEVARRIEKMVQDLKQLRSAPPAEPFSGPALLSAHAAGVLFHEVLGHRLEGQRQRGDQEGQTFARKVGQPILPPFLSIVDDPTQRQLYGKDLAGWYEYDDEGVPATPVSVVRDGVLKNFLMSRMPVRNFLQSNGHGRANDGFMPVGRQGNLIVTSSRTVKDSELRQKLIEEVRRQGKPYGLYFEDIQGGFTLTVRSAPQSFQVLPLMVWRVYPDGRPDELVRGIDIVGTPLASLNHILMTGDTPQIFNGICGAESGEVAVSAVAPAMLFSEIEVQRQAKSNDRPPILPPPQAPENTGKASHD